MIQFKTGAYLSNEELENNNRILKALPELVEAATNILEPLGKIRPVLFHLENKVSETHLVNLLACMDMLKAALAAIEGRES